MTPRPAFPLAGWGLLAGVAIGLIALSFSAVTAFDAVMTFEHALFAALVVEAGAVVEAWALARARGFWDTALALLAVVLSVAVSATYNYIQVQSAGAANGITDNVQLTALALGPLAALVFFSLNFGRTVRRYDAELDAWHKAQQHAAQSAAAQQARAKEQAAYDAQRAQERAAQRAHELALAQLQLANAAQSTRKADDNATQGHAQAAQRPPIPPQEKPARGQSRAAVLALVAQYPGYTNAEYAAALHIDPAQVTRALKETK